METLPGLKTNIGMAVLGLAGIACLLGWITSETFSWIAATVGPLTGIALRQGMKRHPTLPGPGK